MSLKIDSEFKNLIPPLTAEEYQQLEENIIHDGCLHELIAWDSEDIIIDGHNRHEICAKHGIPYKIKYLHFGNREEAIDWIINNQLGRRNISDIQRSYLRGLQYNREKRKIGTNRFTNDRGAETAPLQKTAEKLAEQHKVSERTIFTDAQFVNALDSVSQNVGEDVKQKVLTKEIKTTKEDVMKAAKLPVETQKKLFSQSKVKVTEEMLNHTPKTTQSLNDGDVDFSFLAEEHIETEESKEFNKLLDSSLSDAEMMFEFRLAVCVPIVQECLTKALKEKLLQYPDTPQNARNEDRKALVNTLNLIKKIVKSFY